MKRRIASILAALALCMGLLPGTARAAEGDAGPVTITDNDGQSVTLAAGKYYVINDEFSGGGVTEQDEQPESGPYLTYADGVLTVFGNSDYVRIYGKMALSGDLKVARDPAAQNNVNLTLARTGDSGPALSLNGHTLTLEKVVYFEVLSDDQPAVDGGTIRFTKLFGNNTISIHSENANAVSGDLAVEKAGSVNIGGEPPVFQSLDVKECNRVRISPDSNNTTELSSVIDKITIDRPISLSVLGKYVEGAESIKIEGVMTTDGKIWAEGWGFDSGTHFIDFSVTTPTAYRVGDGWAFYTPGAEGTPAKLTLDGASYNGTINIQQADSVQLELKGENEVTKLGAAALTLTGSGSFTGIFSSETSFTNNFTGTLNAVVECPARTYTVYGDRSTSDFSARGVTCSERTPLTITNGATLTVPERGSVTIRELESLTNHGTIVNGGGIQILLEEKPQGTPNFGTIVNNGGVTIYPTVDITGEEMSAFIKGMGLSGTGTVTVEKTDAEGSKVTENYTNSGLKLFPPAGQDGTLDLSSATDSDTDHWDDQGYKWEVTKGEDDNGDPVITSATLTLAPGFNAETLTLPDTAVTIVTQGESTIETLSPSSDPQKTELTFSGPGPLTIAEQVNIAGGDYNSLTVDAGANVIANGGIYIGASGGVNSTVTVNGTLTIKPESGTAISAGSVAIGDTGVLDISGEAGVQLNGMPKSGDDQYKNLFTVDGDGRFTANCSDYNIRVIYTNTGDLPKDENGNPDAKAVINLGPEYMPDDCEPRVNDDPEGIDLFRISTGAVYSGPLTIHKNHTWSTAWTDGGGDTHHHACIYPGCTEKKDVTPHFYAHGADACRDCGHTRPANTPDSDSGSGSSGGSSGGHSSYTITVEKSSRGEVTSSRARAPKGSTVTLTVTPDSGCALDALTVTDSRGDDILLTEKGGKYTFTMPGRAVTVRAEFRKIPAGYEDCPQNSTCPIWPFTDADATAWYHDGVHYCLEKGLMIGFGDGTFGPGEPITRAQVVQILHNREGRPPVDYLTQFEDVPSGAWYAEAVRWAASEGVVSGYSSHEFGPDDNITREQLAVMLWNFAGSPASTGGLEFTDADAISDYALEALRWAVENGIMSGYVNGQLAPQGLATRAEAAQILKNLQKSKT